MNTKITGRLQVKIHTVARVGVPMHEASVKDLMRETLNKLAVDLQNNKDCPLYTCIVPSLKAEAIIVQEKTAGFMSPESSLISTSNLMRNRQCQSAYIIQRQSVCLDGLDVANLTAINVFHG